MTDKKLDELKLELRVLKGVIASDAEEIKRLQELCREKDVALAVAKADNKRYKDALDEIYSYKDDFPLFAHIVWESLFHYEEEK